MALSEGIRRRTCFCQEIFHSRSTWHGAMVIRCHETGNSFKEVSVRRLHSRIIPKLGESIDWHGMPSQTKGTETLLCEHDVSSFKILVHSGKYHATAMTACLRDSLG